VRTRLDPKTVLQRVLVLERQQGFQDRAAVGGLVAFTRQQIERADAPARPVLSRVAEDLGDYARADRGTREAAVAAALRSLLTGAGSRPSPATETRPEPRAAQSETTSSSPEIASRPKLTVLRRPEELDGPISGLKGVRKPWVEALNRQGVTSIRDLLYYFPRTHYDYTDRRSISRLRLGEKATLVGTVENVRNNRTGRGIVITTASISDDTGYVAVRWFNQPYLPQQLPIGARIAISGEPDVHNGFITFKPRDWELIEDADHTHTGRLVPIYPLSKGLFQKSLRRLIRSVVDGFAGLLEEYLPAGTAESLRLPELSYAVRQYHFPDDEEQKDWAQQRLAFDELLLIQLGLLQRKQSWQQEYPDVAVPVDAELDRRYRASLPFALTQAQEEVLAQIYTDLDRQVPMSRLLEGDVGSGKTVVAAAALLQVAAGGKQGVLMAPTEILAEQHHRTLSDLLAPFGLSCHLLVGSTPAKARKAVYSSSADGSASIVVGTHALIQESIEFARLGLAITDEQHRFGVEQRATLRQKGLHPHVLAMTATPIPRTLAMTIYGDLDVSVIDEMPPGRRPPITTWARRPAEAYGVVRDEVRKGRQAFVICPVIEESADTDMRSALAEHKELSEMVFSDLNVGLLHGRMKPKEKDKTLEAFRRGEYHVLVATSVVEVGIDIPNATAMIIRDAHRFGLAQLHQFRGRVGRGGDQAYCVLLSDSEGDDARERLEAVTATENGFELAEEDLRLRGPGEFWGTRQSGLPELRVAQLGDLPTIQLARQAARELVAADPELEREDNLALHERARHFWAESADLS
jgi:ATP-dependent DNA helicase RecG